jgi:ABC-type Fe2+-enterobactin transport system substrate-binding protein
MANTRVISAVGASKVGSLLEEVLKAIKKKLTHKQRKDFVTLLNEELLESNYLE